MPDLPGQNQGGSRRIRRPATAREGRGDGRGSLAALPARALSGGNQQKLIIGREYHVAPKLLLVSQPTRGVDIGAIEFIHRQLVSLRDNGCAILLVSAELEEVTSLSDRLLVIHEGRIAGEVDPKIATLEEIGLLMTRGHEGLLRRSRMFIASYKKRDCAPLGALCVLLQTYRSWRSDRTYLMDCYKHVAPPEQSTN